VNAQAPGVLASQPLLASASTAEGFGEPLAATFTLSLLFNSCVRLLSLADVAFGAIAVQAPHDSAGGPQEVGMLPALGVGAAHRCPAVSAFRAQVPHAAGAGSSHLPLTIDHHTSRLGPIGSQPKGLTAP
jgi:hypothetical protein